MRPLLYFLFIISLAFAQNSKYYCQEQDRNGICTMEYKGVCGWFKKEVQCFTSPCAVTSGTNCQACGNPNVEYVTDGECPTSDETVTKYYCQANDRNKACTREYRKVCGWYNSSVKCIKYPCAVVGSNRCVACNDALVEYTTDGDCPSDQLQMDANNEYLCKSSDRNNFCSEEYLGVCGWFNEDKTCNSSPCATTTGTICQACNDSKVKLVTKGECPKLSNDTAFSNKNNQSKRICLANEKNGNCNNLNKTFACGWSTVEGTKCYKNGCLFDNVCSACLEANIEIVSDYPCKSGFLKLIWLLILVITINLI